MTQYRTRSGRRGKYRGHHDSGDRCRQQAVALADEGEIHGYRHNQLDESCKLILRDKRTKHEIVVTGRKKPKDSSAAGEGL